MPALTTQQIQTLENLLIEREKQLSAEIAAARQTSRERNARRTHEVTDHKEDADDEAEVEVAQAEAERDIVELNDVKAARLRLSAGLYGNCFDCEEPIGLPRLLVQPAAQRCAKCQAGYEERMSHKR